MAHLIVVFPELLLVLLAETLLLGHYSGYRLLELRRFKALIEETGVKGKANPSQTRGLLSRLKMVEQDHKTLD